MRRNILLIAICFVAIISGHNVFAEEDPVAEMIHKAESQASTPELIEEIDQVIRSNPSNPHVDTLRLRRLRGMKRLYPDERGLREIVKEYETFIQDIGVSTEIGYEAQKDVGYLLYNSLHDKKAAFDHYKSMEGNPILQGDDLQSEYRKVEVYTRLAQSALDAGGMADQVDKYARLVMAYPYLGMKDRQMYDKFYQLYYDAAKAFLIEFRDDAKKLMSIEIYPSHPELYEMRKESLERLLVPENIAENIISDIDLSLDSKKTEMTRADRTTTPSHNMKISPSTPTRKTESTAATKEPIAMDSTWVSMLIAVIVILIIFALVYLRKRK